MSTHCCSSAACRGRRSRPRARRPRWTSSSSCCRASGSRPGRPSARSRPRPCGGPTRSRRRGIASADRSSGSCSTRPWRRSASSAHPGRAGAPPPGPARRQRPRGPARALAGDRPEAAGGGARVRDRADRALARARPLAARGARALRPAHVGARPRPRARPRLDDRPDDRLGVRRRTPARPRGGRALAARSRSSLMLRAVLFDVDFTIARPGPELGPEGYRRLGERFGLDLDPSRYGEAREKAVEGIRRHPELEHDEEIWVAFTERIIRGMGGDADSAYECAVAMTRAWEHAEHFELYEDALPVLEELRGNGLKIGFVSNTGRNLDEFVAHHRLQVDAALASGAFGRTKPHPTIFRAVLERLDVEPAAAAMVGDSLEDDIEGARATGIPRAFLLDREGRYPDVPDRLPDLFALPAALGFGADRS